MLSFTCINDAPLYVQLQGKANVDFWKMNRKSIAEFFDTGIFLYFKKRMGKTILGVMRKLNVTGYLKYTDGRLYMFEGFFSKLQCWSICLNIKINYYFFRGFNKD